MFFKKKSPYVHRERQHNFKAAAEVVPYLIGHLKPTSVIDVGCGLGTWLKVFQEQGVGDCTGIDGTHLDLKKVVIDSSLICLKNMNDPFTLDRTFDLAICLEVAEHLKEESADDFVGSLTKLSKLILFSAAIPFQGGQNHLNEQWPTYWEEKFNRLGFYYSDSIRHLFWENPSVNWWYKQNMFLVCHNTMEPLVPRTKTILNTVHPIVFLEARKVKGVEHSYK